MEDEESKSKMQAGESGFRHCRPATGEREREREAECPLERLRKSVLGWGHLAKARRRGWKRN